MHEIKLPRLSTNDDTCTLREWKVADAGRVEVDTVIALFEDSKSVVEVTATAAGFLKRNGDVGKEYAVGAPIAYVLPDEAAAKAFAPGAGGLQPPKLPADMLVTKGAKELMAERGISEEEVKALMKDVIRRSDIEGLLKSKTDVENHIGTELSKQQRTVGRVVMESHRTIPKAFLLVKMVCEPLLQRLEQGSFGLTEVVVKMIGDLARKFPEIYSRLDGTRVVEAEAGIHVGITLDLGGGLFIPVVRDADSVGLAEIAQTLTDYRKKAMDGGFREQDLTGGNISLSLNMNENVVVSIPVIVPGQACMVSLGGIIEEVARAPEGGGFAVRRYVNIGLAYDHRLINGKSAMDYLEALRRKIEFPGSNRWLA